MLRRLFTAFRGVAPMKKGDEAASPLSRLRERVPSECEAGEGLALSEEDPLPAAFGGDPLPQAGEGKKA